MKGLFKFITLLLCVELIIGPVVPSGIFGIESAKAQSSQSSCQGKPGFEWNSTLNRCLTSAQTASVMNAVASCPQGDAECYKRNAQNAFQAEVNKGTDGVGERKKDGFVSKIAGAAAIAVPVTVAAIGLSTNISSCMSPSYYAMVAGAAALIIGENLANMGHRKRLKEIKKSWGEIINPEQANGDKDKQREISLEAQSEAFEKLAEAEDSLVKAAKMKTKFFGAATLAYGASTVMALLEYKKSKALDVMATVSSKASASLALAAAVSNPAGADTKVIATQAELATLNKIATEEAAEKASGASGGTIVPTAPLTATSLAMTAIKAAAALVALRKGVVVSATKTVAAALDPASRATAVTSLTAAQKALADALLLLADAKSSYCIGLGIAAYSPKEVPTSLYSYYTNGYKPDFSQEIQSIHNLENSTDLASFMANKKEFSGQAPTEEDYLSYKDLFVDDSMDSSAFEIFKATSIAVIKNISLIQSAHAREEALLQEVDDFRDANEDSDALNNPRRRSPSPAAPFTPAPAPQNSNNVDTDGANTFKEDEAKGVDLLTIGIGVGIGYLLLVKAGLRDKLVAPTGRAIFSGVMASLTLIMAKHSSDQAEASERRANLLRKMKGEFNSASSALYACKSEDRNDPSKPNCYCYTAEGGRNNNRGNSQICQKLWAQLKFKPGQYLGGNAPGACVDKNRKADPSCKCKQAKSCLTVSMPKISGFGAGVLGMLNSAMEPVNNLNNGRSIDSINIDRAGLESKAARMRALAKKIEDEKGMENYRKDKDKNEKALLSQLQSLGGNLPSGSAMGSNGASNLPSSPAEAVKELEKEIKENATGFNGGDTIALPESTGEGEPEFGLSEEGLAAQETAMAEVMKEDLDFGGNDINSGSKTNIFELLSNRYQRSGMRRLFDEKGETKADEAAKSDIAD